MKISVVILLCMFIKYVYALPSYIIGDNPSATHFIQERTDIYNITQMLLNDVKNAGGGRVTIANGTYVLSKNIELGNNTHLNGFGMFETILQLNDFAAKFIKAGFVRTVRTSNIIITNLTLDGNKHRQIVDGVDNTLPKNISYKYSTKYGRYGVFTEGCFNVTFDAVRIMNFQGYGFDPHGQKKTNIYGDVLVIRNCLSTHNDWDGFTLDQTKNIYVFNCTARSNGRHGFNVVTGSRNVTIENSTSFVDGYYYPTGTGCGVQVQNNQGYPTQRVVIRNMLVIDPKKGGICIEGVSNVTATNNRVYGKTCFRIDSTVNVNIRNNSCFNSNPLRRFVMNSKNTNLTISNTRNLTDTISAYSGQNLTIIIGYSNNAFLKVRPERDAYYVFQQAFDEIKANGRGRLYIEDGEYILSSFLEVGDNVTVIGAGLNKTVLKLQNFARPWWIPGTGTKRSGFLRSTHCNNLRFYNLTIDGNKENQNTDKYSKYGRFGFFTEACDNVLVDGMGIINFQGYGFDPHGIKATKTWSVNLTIINSYAGNNDWDGYTIDQSTNVLIANNTAYHNGRHGYNIVTGTYNIIIINNTAYDNGYYYYHGNEGCGIAIQNNLQYGTRNALVKNNTFVNSKDAGICLNDVVNITVVDNTVYRNNTITCIKTIKVTSTIVANNTCLSSITRPPKSPVVRPPPPPPKKKSIKSASIINKVPIVLALACVSLTIQVITW
jgi:parallel beta-helix repeat protein